MLMTLNNITQPRLLHWNSNGISNYSLLKQFEHLQETQNIYIASLNETFLNETHKPYFTNYILYRNDRSESRGGGVALMIHRSIQHTLLPLTKTAMIENLSVEVSINRRQTVITTAYCPRYNANFCNDIIALTPDNKEFIQLGDLNAKHSAWNCTRNNSAGSALNSLQQSCNFFIYSPENPTLYPHQRNRCPSIVDLILSNTSLNMKLNTLDYYIPSDHRPVLCTIECSTLGTVDLGRYNLNRCDWKVYKSEINRNTRVIVESYNSKSTIDKEIDSFVNLIVSARDIATPKTVQTKRITLPRNTLKYIGERNKFERKQQRASDHRSILFYEQCTKFLTRIINKTINGE